MSDKNPIENVSMSEERIDNKLYVFISIDLVGATDFKLRCNTWYSTFISFYENAINDMEENVKNIEFWKYIGDEILFYKKINKKEDISSILKM